MDTISPIADVPGTSGVLERMASPLRGYFGSMAAGRTGDDIWVGELHIRRPSLATAKRKTAGAIDTVVERVEEVFSRDEQADRND